MDLSQENIGAFGGDRTNVTLMGHGKGGIFVNFLMISSAVPTGKSNLLLLDIFQKKKFSHEAVVLPTSDVMYLEYVLLQQRFTFNTTLSEKKIWWRSRSHV